MDQRYEFDAATGNLKSRQDALRNRTELFEYDALQRLTLYAGKKVEYTPDGNIVRKGDAGEMVYTNPNRPYAVTGNTPEKEACIHSGLQVGYTAADRPAWIEEGSRRAEFTYNALFDRVRMRMIEEGKTVYTRYYLGGNYEVHCDSSGTEERLYVGGDCYEAPALLVKKEGKTDVRFLHRDYLGSILQVADNKGKIIEENSFYAWGSRRDPDTQKIYTGTEAPSLMTGRGFTGHEHLDGFGLIHMNARLYDPILGRFLSPDPYVQLPDFTQAMNRYGYCMNRPLCYVDKNGEIIGWIIAGALIGGAINVATHWDNIGSVGQFFGYFGVGAAAGALAGGTVGGAGFIGGAISGMVGGSASGFTLGMGNTLMAGGSFLNALGNGTMGAFSGAICGGALGGVIGGGTAIIKGQNFWHGNAIAQGRGMFSWKNTAVGETGSSTSVPEAMPDAMPKTPKISEPTSTSGQASEMSIEDMSQPQHDYTRFIVESNGITHDLKPTIDRIYSGKLYTFRHDGTIYHNDKGLLPPLKDGNVYKEYVHIVNPQNATRPGPMRIVIGNNGIWFTPDHYITFIRIKF